MSDDYDDSDDWRQDQEERSIFFDEKASEFRLKEIVEDFEEINGQDYEWNLDSLNITEEAWEKVTHSRLRPVEVFCHPKIVRKNKDFVRYFQYLAILSGKSLGHLGFNSEPEDRYQKIKDKSSVALNYAQRVNQIISTLIENRPDIEIDEEILLMWRSMQAGSTSGGSWRNFKGDMEEVRIKRRLFMKFKEEGLINEEEEYEGAYGQTIDLLDIDYELHFKSEPDIGFKKKDENKYRAVVEIKGGIDPAGVLERFGAILKSFGNELEKNEDLITFLTLQRAAYTPQARKRIEKNDIIQNVILIEGQQEKDYEEAAEKLFEAIKENLDFSPRDFTF